MDVYPVYQLITLSRNCFNWKKIAKDCHLHADLPAIIVSIPKF